MAKRYFLMYMSDQKIYGSYDHHWADASTIKAAKGYISKVREAEAEHHPRDFRIYDSWGGVQEDEVTGVPFVPTMYQED